MEAGPTASIPITRPHLPPMERFFEIVADLFASRMLSNFAKYTGLVESRAAAALGHLAPLRVSSSERTRLTLVDAMICARPSVVTDVGGNLEWINERPPVSLPIRSRHGLSETPWSVPGKLEHAGNRSVSEHISSPAPRSIRNREEAVVSLLIEAAGPVNACHAYVSEPVPTRPPASPSDSGWMPNASIN